MKDIQSSAPAAKEDPGRPVDQVRLNIYYDIIEHFSEHTYGLPEKAIEELVVNGYDAFAKIVGVWLPGKWTSERYVVWDDGLSMDADGLKDMWQIANSPKRGETRTIERGGEEREVIGKFGIGKLASYTLGDSIEHVCKKDGTFLRVRIDYDKLRTDLPKQSDDGVSASPASTAAAPAQQLGESAHPLSSPLAPYQSDIYELTEVEARDWLLSVFNATPDEFDKMFGRPSWTFAVVSNLRGGQDELTASWLSFILGNGMPLRPDFEVKVDGAKVEPRLGKAQGTVDSWTFGSKEIQDQLRNLWKTASNEGRVSGTLKFGEKVGLDPNDQKRAVPYVELPEVGVVWGTTTLHSSPLHRTRASKLGRSYGFFVMVKGRLVNGTDPELFLPDPSFGSFYSSQFVLHADGLDTILLASRERMKEGSALSTEFQVVQQAVYLVSRRRHQKEEQKALDEAKVSTRLPAMSRDHYLDPIASYWNAYFPTERIEFDLKAPPVEVESLGSDAPVSKLTKNGFELNGDHPYSRRVDKEFGGSTKKASAARRELHAHMTWEPIFAGFLLSLGIPTSVVENIEDWRDQMYRLIARQPIGAIEALQNQLEEQSYQSGKKFEAAIKAVFDEMGYYTEHDGDAGQKDILVVAPNQKSPLRIVVEAKGKSADKPLPNDDAEISGAGNHMIKAGAKHAVVVAREFAGFKKPTDDGPAILGECEATPGTSILTVEALNALLSAMYRHRYRLDHPEVIKVLTIIESPKDKLARIAALESPLEVFDFRQLLQLIWDAQGGKVAKHRDVSVVDLFREHYEGNWTKMESDETIGATEDDLMLKLTALQTMAFPLVHLDPTAKRVALYQNPNQVSAQIEATLALSNQT